MSLPSPSPLERAALTRQFKLRVGHWAKRLDTDPQSISVRAMKNKWASYSTSGRLTFDSKLLELPRTLQDYVIVHELLLVHVPNHGMLWKALMRAHLGVYESLERRLKNLGGSEGV